MPIYEYRCKACDMRFEEFQKMSDPPLSECPLCGSDRVTKLVSATAFHLKGGGWYSDHYGLKGSSDNGSTGSGSATSTPDSSTSSSATGSSSGDSASTAPASSPSTSSSSSSSDSSAT